MGIGARILGGILGTALGGPLGGIIGFGLGSVLDKGAKNMRFQNTDDIRKVYKENENPDEDNFFRFSAGLFSVAAKIAKADGVVSNEEIESLEDFIKNNLKFSAKQRRFAITIFQAAKDDNVTAQEYLKDFNLVVDKNMTKSILNFYVILALSDGELNINELEILKDAEKIFDLPTGTLDELLEKYNIKTNGGLSEQYETLGVVSSATNDEVAKAYRAKVRDFHPDKIAAKNLPPEFTQFAASEFTKIHAAYKIIKEQRRM